MLISQEAILTAAHRRGAVYRPVTPEMWRALGRITAVLNDAELSAEEAREILALGLAMIDEAAGRTRS